MGLIYLPVEEKIKKSVQHVSGGRFKEGKRTEKGKYRVKGDGWGPE